jgi:hypothetical protein
MLSQNHFPESNRHMLDFVHPILLFKAGDALMTAIYMAEE